MTMGSKEKLYSQWTNGKFFSPVRFVTKDALQSVIEKSNFGPNDFANLQNIEIVAPEKEIAILGPSDHDNSMTICFLPYQIEVYSPTRSQRAIVNGLARACAVNNGTHKNEVEDVIRHMLNQWGWSAASNERRFLDFAHGMFLDAQRIEIGKEPYTVICTDITGKEVFQSRVLGVENGTLNLETPWREAENFETIEISLRSEDGETVGPQILDLAKDEGVASEPAHTRKAAGAAR